MEAVRHFIRNLTTALALALATAAAWAAGAVNTDAQGLALQGHDPVAYFTQSKAVKGSVQWSVSHAGATYWFVNEANREAFLNAPQKYLPQYGGYCAYGVAQGAKPDIDPNAFAVVNGKLYLNLSPAIQKRWQQDVSGHIQAADAKWPELSAR
jgi:YHS domain-containing protein